MGEEVEGTVITLVRESGAAVPIAWSVWWLMVGQEPHFVVCLNFAHLVHLIGLDLLVKRFRQ